jgi:hypothetical protein
MIRFVPRHRRVGAGLLLALVLAGSGAFTSAASADVAPTNVQVVMGGAGIRSQGQDCDFPVTRLKQAVYESGSYVFALPTMTCGSGVYVVAVEVRVSCVSRGDCRVDGATLVTVIAHPGNWAYWVQDFPPYPGTTYVNIGWEREAIFSRMHLTYGRG